ncbi:hypothetical protein [Nakamurella lactea]|uniref:hypothetical protein n=1 Tax=Nakamurella lactea TaxID=459515 RepID=UPI000490AA8C|nr:hypothetical protein [Nakamurella lactea]
MADNVEPPKITHLGMQRGVWPVQVFTSSLYAANWAADANAGVQTRYIWPVLSVELGKRQKAEHVPARTVLVDYDDYANLIAEPDTDADQ